MISNETVFQRAEIKYLLSEVQEQQLMKRLREHVCPDRYGKSTICSVYYDTPSYRLIRQSLEKPIYKEKLRLRSYDLPNRETPVFVELKKKYRGTVFKRRERMPYEDACRFLQERELPAQASQILREIHWFLSFYPGLAPAMLLSYERTAYIGKEDPRLRVTFDHNLVWREARLSLLDGGLDGQPLLNPGDCLLEWKLPGAMPVWLAALLDSLAIYPTSYSKYGKAYQRLCGECRTDAGKKGEFDYAKLVV